jgi:hypothetical protein
MQRRKFIAGIGSLAAAGAAGIGTGAFTSTNASRELTVDTANDADALLGLEACDTPNGNEYVDEAGNAIAIELTSSNGGDGVNTDAYTVIRSLFKVTNQGSQPVYVWAEGLPDEVRMFHDDDDNGENYKQSGAGNNQGAFSDTSNLNPDDPADQNDPQNPGGYEAAPLLNAGDMLSDVGLLVDTRTSDVNFDDDITIKAVAASEL